MKPPTSRSQALWITSFALWSCCPPIFLPHTGQTSGFLCKEQSKSFTDGKIIWLFSYDFFLTSEARHIWIHPALSPRELVPKLQEQTCISTYFDPYFLFHFVPGKGQILSTPPMTTTCSLLTLLLRLKGFVWSLPREGISKGLTQLWPIPGWPQNYNWPFPRWAPGCSHPCWGCR